MPLPRQATLVTIVEITNKRVPGAILDRALALYFPGPKSVTGEDVLELHVHGGIAVADAVLTTILRCDPDVRLAEPGEFTRRALENGKLDVLEVEALGELLSAETSLQLQQANRQLTGELGVMIKAWSSELIDIRAMVEAELDFSDESDVDTGVIQQALSRTASLHTKMNEILGTADRGERIREGIRVVISGRPNVGKSSLMNILLGRDVSIVSARPGTTRDLIEHPLQIEGWPVILSDTAGIRASVDEIELEGVRRAGQAARNADVILSLFSQDVPEISLDEMKTRCLLRVRTKCDLDAEQGADAINVSSLTGAGIPELRRAIAAALRTTFNEEPALLSRQRQREAMRDACNALARIGIVRHHELIAEELRLASRALGRLSGHVDLDSVLDRLFEGFCIGK